MKNQTPDDALREQLAAIEHERWSDWHKWCHKVINENIRYNKPLEIVMSRWDIQASKPYKDLSDKEKASDMEQVDRYWHLIEAYVATHTKTILEQLKAELPEKRTDEWNDRNWSEEYGESGGFNDAIETVTALVESKIKELKI